jgi:hypothetical protein
MKKILTSGLVAGIVAGALLFVGITNAAPNTNFSWTAPTNYEDGTIIPGTDILSYTIYCGTTLGGPYDFSYPAGTGETTTVDVATCVQGTPGTYYFVATAFSPDFNAESAFSNEATRIYTAIDLGKVPTAPVLISVN